MFRRAKTESKQPKVKNKVSIDKEKDKKAKKRRRKRRKKRQIFTDSDALAISKYTSELSLTMIK